jgi:hypothetical protein
MLDQNQHPINQACKQVLERLELRPDSEQLYLHQLMMYALENCEIRAEPRRFLGDLLGQLDATDPSALMRWVSLEGSERWWTSPEELLKLEPLEAGELLLHALHQETAARIESYP